MAIPSCCEECMHWEKFGKECWYYWELKKKCTMHSADIDGQILQ